MTYAYVIRVRHAFVRQTAYLEVWAYAQKEPRKSFVQ